LFLGLDLMQSGLDGFEDRLTPDLLPADSLAGRAALVGIGLAISLVVRSASAGVAMALVLIGGGAIGLPQAAAMIVGMEIGATFTGLLATIGGSRAMRRTAVAHLLFNLFAGAVAFALLGPAVAAALAATGGDAQTALVLFHTGLNVLGVALVLPFIGTFARAVERLVPDRTEAMTAALSPGLLDDPGAALDAAATASRAISERLFAGYAAALGSGLGPAAAAEAAEAVAAPLEALNGWLGRLSVPEGSAALALRYSALLHQVDHLRRLRHRAAQEGRVAGVLAERRLARFAQLLGGTLARAVGGEAPDRTRARLERLANAIAAHEARLRRDLAVRADLRGMPPARLYALTDGIRWLHRSADHAERILHYRMLAEARPVPQPAAPPAAAPPAAASG
jgi:phosphate:Na+ symporter